MLVPVAPNTDPREANRRQRTPIPARLLNQDPKKFPPVYIFNIFPREHVIPLGGWGTKRVPACEAGKPYSEPLILKSIEMQDKDLADGAGNMGLEFCDGIDLANDLLGVRSMNDKPGLYTSNMTWWGLFATENEVPTQKELTTAREKLTKMMKLIFDNGKSLVQGNHPEQISANHNIAAEFLNLTPPWGAITSAQKACKSCAESIQGAAKKCRFCGADPDKDPAK